jgi:hypothetical protein
MSKWLRFCALLGSITSALSPWPAGAQVSTEEAASVIVFPKVIADGSRDTFIQISNTSNSQVRATCFYVNAQRLNPGQPPGPFNPPLWQALKFDIALTAQQPTNWAVSIGRPNSPLDPTCRFFPTPSYDCYGAGEDPGDVPPVPPDFFGEVLCIEVDALLNPISGNHLTGEATIKDLSTGDVVKYSAIGLEGFETNDGDGALVLGQEYAACPQTWLLDHTTEGSEIPSVGAGSDLHTNVTIVPCTQDFDNAVFARVTVQLSVTNEFEQSFSASTTVDCWGDFALSDVSFVFDSSALGTLTAHTQIRPSVASGGFLVVAEEFRSTGGVEPVVASAAANVYAEGARAISDVIRLP